MHKWIRKNVATITVVIPMLFIIGSGAAPKASAVQDTDLELADIQLANFVHTINQPELLDSNMMFHGQMSINNAAFNNAGISDGQPVASGDDENLELFKLNKSGDGETKSKVSSKTGIDGKGKSDDGEAQGETEPDDGEVLGEAEPDDLKASEEAEPEDDNESEDGEPGENDTSETGEPEPLDDSETDDLDTEQDDIPEFLQMGLEHPFIAELQARLMELGFMENAEPTEYFGSITMSAIMIFQRQNELTQDGIVGPSTLEMIMSPDAKYYAVAKGVTGDDVLRIQRRLYETGYLSSADMLTGYFGDITEAAVLKMQEVNGLLVDGKVGQQTIDLLYSEEIKPNFLSFGEKSEAVLAYQNRLKELGYLTTTPDSVYGGDTLAAIKQFQSRNDLIVDGYLGPSTIVRLNSSDAIPNGLSIGETSDNVKRVQELLIKYGYLGSSNATGYFGELTEAAVKKFQSANGLTADGTVGMKTMAKLTGTDVKNASSASASGSSSSANNSSSGNSSNQSSGNSSDKGSTSSSYTGNASVSSLISVATSKVGSPYVIGAKGPNSFDCSGFVYWCLNQIGVKQSYLTSSGWRNIGKYVRVSSYSNIQPGDIIVVSGHVGIAGYNGTVIDASSSEGKIVHRSLSSWWKNRFIVAWRIF